MYTLKPAPVHVAGLPSKPHERQAITMSRGLPITSLLSSESHPNAVEKFAENGRTYYRYRDDMYMFPADDIEHERLDIMHTLIYMTAMNKTLHLAVLPDNPRRILDVGFGSGYWMLTMASKYPDTEIIGFDLDNVRHNSQERNCFFRTPVDFNAPLWDIEDASVDLVHLSQLCGCVPDWHHLYTKAYRSLRPGTGQIEHIELDWTPRSTERQLPPQAQALSNWWAWTLHASQLAGKPLDYREDTEELLERAGFVDIGHKRVRVPLFYPGTRDKREYLLSHGYQMAMGYTNSQSFTGFSMALLTRYFGWTPQQVADICANALAVVQQTPLPLYITLHVWTARRPQG